MPSNKAINKVIYGSTVLIDLTNDTITAADVINSKTFHASDGTTKSGTCLFDVDSRSVTATAAEVLTGKTFAKNGSVLTGTMPNRGAIAGTISVVGTPYTVSAGYHDGSGVVSIDSTEAAKIIPANIREGITILGVQGTMSGLEEVNAEIANVTPDITQQTITPSTGYNYISQVVVAAIPYSETENAAQGLTVTIGA